MGKVRVTQRESHETHQIKSMVDTVPGEKRRTEQRGEDCLKVRFLFSDLISKSALVLSAFFFV